MKKDGAACDDSGFIVCAPLPETGWFFRAEERCPRRDAPVGQACGDGQLALSLLWH